MADESKPVGNLLSRHFTPVDPTRPIVTDGTLEAEQSVEREFTMYPPPNPVCDRCKPYPGDPCICFGYGGGA